jgi:hypothetical protein
VRGGNRAAVIVEQSSCERAGVEGSSTWEGALKGDCNGLIGMREMGGRVMQLYSGGRRMEEVVREEPARKHSSKNRQFPEVSVFVPTKFCMIDVGKDPCCTMA